MPAPAPDAFAAIDVPHVLAFFSANPKEFPYFAGVKVDFSLSNPYVVVGLILVAELTQMLDPAASKPLTMGELAPTRYSVCLMAKT